MTNYSFGIVYRCPDIVAFRHLLDILFYENYEITYFDFCNLNGVLDVSINSYLDLPEIRSNLTSILSFTSCDFSIYALDN